MNDLAAVVTAVSLILCANVYAALWHRLEPGRVLHYWRVWWKQKTESERAEFKQEAGLWAAVVVLFVDVLMVAAK